MKNLLRFLITGLILCLSGCAYIPEQVTLNPQTAPVVSSSVGWGKTVAVQVVDARPSSTIGSRPVNMGPSANISLANDPAQILQQMMFDNLRANGFTPVAYATNPNVPRLLTVKLLGLDYQQRATLFSNTVLISAVIEATASNKEQIYDQTYRAAQNLEIYYTPTAQQDEQQINRIFTQALNQLLDDRNVINVLSH